MGKVPGNCRSPYFKSESRENENKTRTFRVVVNDEVVIANNSYAEADNVSGLIASNTVQTMVSPPLKFIFLPAVLSRNQAA